ncbi:MAG: OB-fold nucleic acid binding domain-containing protein, partial [Gammaproteobacteria bacterium]
MQTLYSLLTTPCEHAAVIGKRLANALAKLGIHTLQDILFHLPLRYQDRTHLTPIHDLRVGDQAVLQGTITSQQQLYKPRMQLVTQITDGTGNCYIRMFYFNNAQKQQLRMGARILCFGEVRHGRFGLELIHPEYRIVDSNYIPAMSTTYTPIYPPTEGVSQTTWRKIT